MKKFFVKSLKLALILYLIFWLLDAGFTYIFQKGNYTKIQWLAKVKEQQYDYVIHGNSRAYTTVDIGKVNKSTGKKGINISVDGSSITDQYLMLKLFLSQRNKVKTMYLQVDPFSSNTEQIFDFAIPKFFPYLKNDIVFDHFKRFGYEWYAYRYIPFYRYAKYNTLWGAHEVLNDAFGLLPQDFDQYGDYFYPDVNYKGPDTLRDLTFELNARYKYLFQIINLCRSANIKLILFTAPVADIRIDDKYKANILAFKEKMRNLGVQYYNFGDLYGNDPRYFYNEIHITKAGAEDFTRYLIPVIAAN
jgi:hypothetical protein